MGAILVVVMIIGLMYVGAFYLVSNVRKSVASSFRSRNTSSAGGAPPSGRLPATDNLVAHCEVILQALELNGYNKTYRSGDVRYVDDPVLARMFADLDADGRLEWHLPPLGLRLKVMPDDAPADLKAAYGWVVITSSHAIGINRPS